MDAQGLGGEVIPARMTDEQTWQERPPKLLRLGSGCAGRARPLCGRPLRLCGSISKLLRRRGGLAPTPAMGQGTAPLIISGSGGHVRATSLAPPTTDILAQRSNGIE